MSILLAFFGAASQGLVWGVMALGVYITFKILDFADMTCDGSFALGGCVSATLIVAGVDPLLSLIIATCAGALAGAVTGLLHTKLQIPAILSGILTMISLYSINLAIMGGKSNTPIMTRTSGIDTIITNIIKLFPENIQTARNTKTAITIVVGLFTILLIIGLLYWFFGTELGSALRATGNNEAMIRALGVSTDNMKILGLLIGNALVGMSGALVAQTQEVADIGAGTGAIVIGLASIVIGEVIFGNKLNFAFKLLSVVIGSIIYRIIIAVVLQMGLNTSYLKLLTAVIVAFALSIPVIFKPRKKKEGN
ncbi:MAG TPA: ABC transporter permease [Candidatus Merdenecus merdavium]|nr:ABC transporter permease [Candidatus Merdenecus merdavium]